MKGQLFNEKQIKKDKNSHILSFEDGTVPNIYNLKKQLIEILTFVTQDEIMKLKFEDHELFKQHIINKFPEFSNKYYNLLSTLLDDTTDDIEPFIKMIEIFEKSNNSNINENFELYKEELSKKYMNNLNL